MTHRRTWALPTGLLIGYCGIAAAAGIAVAAGGTRRTAMALAILAVAALLLAARATAPTAAGLAVMAWQFYSGPSASDSPGWPRTSAKATAWQATIGQASGTASRPLQPPPLAATDSRSRPL